MAVVHFATEGLVDAAVAQKLIEHVGAEVGRFSQSFGGKSRLDDAMPKLAAAAATGVSRLVLRDLDRDAPCAAALLEKIGPSANPRFCLRIAVREIEAWLMADVESFSQALKLNMSDIPKDLDSIDDPKRWILDHVRSRGSRLLQRQLLSRDRFRSFEGPEYASFMKAFAIQKWNVKRAISSGRSVSLSRSATRLKGFVAALGS